MESFDNSEYAYLISELLHNVHYIKTSNRDKIKELGAYAEILVRKLLDIGNDYQITLGQIEREYNKKKQTPIGNKLHGLDDELRNKLFETIKQIALLRNKATHTQYTGKFSDEEVGEVEDAILDLYALIFIQYFMDIKVDIYTSGEVLRGFSFLPPIIRYRTWNYLFEKNKNNIQTVDKLHLIQVVDKLCLSTIKTYDKKRAYEWLEDNAEAIRAIPHPNEDEIRKYIQTRGIEVHLGAYCVELDFQNHKNIYDLLLSKINNPNTSKNESGKMYGDFEEAIKFYEAHKDSIQGDSEEIKKFCSLIEFVYIGRKPK